MKNNFKIFVFVVLCLGFLLAGCEKDLPSEVVNLSTSENTNLKGQVEIVKLADVPFLVPSIVSFNNNYRYLNGNDLENRNNDNLNLDLDNIIKYVYANNLKTYTVAIRNRFEPNEDKYFENLYVFEKNGVYESFILRYNATDDSKIFDLKTFTGSLDIYNGNQDWQGNVNYNGGAMGCWKVVLGGWTIIFWDNGDISVGGGPSSSSTTGNTTTTTGPTGGTMISIAGAPSIGGSSPGGSTTSSPNTNVSTIPVFYPYAVPTNAAQFIHNLGLVNSETYNSFASATKTIVNNYITTNINNPEELFSLNLFLSNSAQLTKISQLSTNIQVSLFNFLLAEIHSQTNANFIKEIVNQMIANPGVFSSITPFLIEKNIDVTALDECSKILLNQAKNSRNNDIAKIIAKLGNSDTIYNTKIVTQNIGINLGLANWTGKFLMNGAGNRTPFDYKIGLNSNMVAQGTKIQIYATMLHELIHAYFLSIIDDCISSSSGCQPLEDLPYLWNRYVIYKNGESSDPTDSMAQHNQLATNYVNIITAALQEYQPGLPQQLYSDLAWGGLNGTIPFTLLPIETRTRIDKVNEAEATNQPQYNPSGILTYFPAGIPCN